jgi:hypothetical protein
MKLGISEKTQYRKEIIRATVICISFILLTFFYYYIDKFTSGVFFAAFFLLIPITFISILVLWVKGFISIYKSRKKLTLHVCLPTIIYSFTFLFMFFNKYSSIEQFQSGIEFRACYEGTMNQAIIKFRKDKTFELNWVGILFASVWYTGEWEKKGDVVTLKYNGKKSDRLGDSLLIKDGNLILLKPFTDSTEKSNLVFYLGFCRGEN